METLRGKKWTPAMTVPQIHTGIAMILYNVYQWDDITYAA